MKKETAKDIATVLIAISGDNFDGFAFEDAETIITEGERDKIIKEIQALCRKMISKVEDKYNIELNVGSTKEVIERILYE